MDQAVELTPRLVRSIPKVEFHVHVETCIGAETIKHLANELDVRSNVSL